MSNEAMREAWATSGATWVAKAETFDSVLGPFADAVLAAADIVPQHRVLDIGCGAGVLLQLAEDLGASPVGVDISEPMVEAARRRVPRAAVICDDAQTADLLAAAPGAAFDRVISRFGVMFFDDPVAAFTNIRRASAPGGRLAFVCWRDGENPMFTLGTHILADRLANHRADTSGSTPDPAAPGPMALGDPDRVRAILSGAGWDVAGIDAFDALCDYTRTGGDGVEERLTMILSSTIGRQARAELEPALGAARWSELVDEVRTELRDHLVDGGLKFTGRTWVVTATNREHIAGGNAH